MKEILNRSFGQFDARDYDAVNITVKLQNNDPILATGRTAIAAVFQESGVSIVMAGGIESDAALCVAELVHTVTHELNEMQFQLFMLALLMDLKTMRKRHKEETKT